MSRGKKVLVRVDKLDRAQPRTSGPSPAVGVLRQEIKLAMGRGWTIEQIRPILGADKAENVPEDRHAEIIEALREEPPSKPEFDSGDDDKPWPPTE